MKNLAIFILIAIIAGLLWFFITKKEERTSTNMPQKDGIQLEAEEVSREADSLGKEHVIYKESDPIIKTIELVVEDKARVDSLMKLVGIKENQLKSITNAYGRVEAENLELKKRPADTAYLLSDNYLHLSFTPKSDSIALASFGYNFDFQSVSYDPRKWHKRILNWNDATYTNMWSTDIRAKIRGYEKLTMIKKDPIIGYSIGASSEYIPAMSLVRFGGKASIRFKRIYLNGSYMYYSELNDWYPSVGVDIKLLEKR